MLLGIAALSLIGGGAALYAQLEGSDRGIAPIDSSSTFEVTGIAVDVTAKTADAARTEGWRQALSKGWKALWAKTNGRPISEAPTLSDSVLSGMMSGVIVEQEQIGPNRYIATLGVLFDRSRAGPLLGVEGLTRRSQPMLVIPVMLTGGSFQSFESRNEWQRAWAQFRTNNSPIDYVRPVGNGIDPLLLNVAQAQRRNRSWWRMILEQYGAADIVVPEVQLKRTYPGGPVIGTFTARHGPDYRLIDRFTLRVENSAALPRLLQTGVQRIDAAYARALAEGRLTFDRSLIPVAPPVEEEAAEEIEAASEAANRPPEPVTVPAGVAVPYSIRYASPTSNAVAEAEISVSGIPGVTSALTVSTAMGGTSTMRVTFAGDGNALAAALRARGWTVAGSGSTLTISRPGQ
ncbi:heavy-metal-associated domain-containing protein [Allosphingosinicella flava]|uniref:Heavy-metal-associated domain-containing protein n=1 Tax=Allosphingosinicella flava TaxID=2771430 RepID=A0A7T2GLR7_9SPHN|nr:heavy-metal-associated domain-containing protein [Sphingosinicella flava]